MKSRIVALVVLAALLFTALGSIAAQEAPAVTPKFTHNTTHSVSLGSVAPTIKPRASAGLTHSSDMATVAQDNSISCNAGGLHADNGYYRVFDLATFGINEDLVISSVDLGIELADSTGASQPIFVNFYTSTANPPTFATMTLVQSNAYNIPDNTTLSVVNLPAIGLIPGGSILVVEVFTPDGQTDGNKFFIGSNTAAESDDSFLVAPDCGVTEPTSTTSIGFPDMHVVLQVNGNTNMLVNGGMEVDSDANNLADGWTVKNATGDKRMCNTVEKTVSLDGLCAFRFKGGAGETSVLQQVVDITGLTFLAGDTLELSAVVNASSASTAAKAKLIVKYGDGTSSKVKLSLSQTAGYVTVSGETTLTSATVTGITLKIANSSAAGKIYLDDVSVNWSLAPVRGLIPLPK